MCHRVQHPYERGWGVKGGREGGREEGGRQAGREGRGKERVRLFFLLTRQQADTFTRYFHCSRALCTGSSNTLATR